MEDYIKKDVDFSTLHKKYAEAASLEIWEAKGLKMMQGLVDKCQPAIFQMFMRNKFGWDKKDSTDKDQANLIVQVVEHCYNRKGKPTKPTK